MKSELLTRPLLENPEPVSAVPAHIVPLFIAELAARQAALSAIRGLLTSRLLAGEAVHAPSNESAERLPSPRGHRRRCRPDVSAGSGASVRAPPLSHAIALPFRGEDRGVGQDVLALDQNQVLQRRRVGDDNHSKGRSAAWRVGEFSLALLSQMRTGVALTLEVLNGVFEGDAVALEEGVQIIPRWDVEELAHLNPNHPVRPVRFCGERFHGRP